MNILVTGGLGFIGTNTCLYLKQNNINPTALDNFSKEGSKENSPILKRNAIKILKADVKNLSSKDLGKYDAIIHLAAVGSTQYSIENPYADFLNTCLGTLNILEIAKLTKTPLIYASTCKVYSSELNTVPTIENDHRYIWNFNKSLLKKVRTAVVAGVTKYGVNEFFPMDSSGYYPHAPYGVSHATADLYCQEYFHMYGTPTVINRMSTIYGPYQRGNKNQGWVDWVISSKIQGKNLELVTNGKTVRDILWVEDLARLFLLEINNLKKTKGKVYNIGGGINNALSIRETVKYLNKFQYAKKIKLIRTKKRPADQKIYISDIRKAFKDLKWRPTVTAYEGIQKLFSSYLSNPHLV